MILRIEDREPADGEESVAEPEPTVVPPIDQGVMPRCVRPGRSIGAAMDDPGNWSGGGRW